MTWSISYAYFVRPFPLKPMSEIKICRYDEFGVITGIIAELRPPSKVVIDVKAGAKGKEHFRRPLRGTRDLGTHASSTLRL